MKSASSSKTMITQRAKFRRLAFISVSLAPGWDYEIPRTPPAGFAIGRTIARIM